MRFVRTLALGALLASLGGCATKADDPSTDREGPLRTREDGRLTTDPPALDIKELEGVDGGKPQSVVTRLWFWGQWGSAPNIVAQYDPLIRERVGPSNIAGAFAQLRPGLIASRPEILGTAQTELGTEVFVNSRTKDAAPRRHSFTVRPGRDGQWRIVHDTLLEEGLAAYVQTIEDRNPGSEGPSAEAVRAGLLAARDYRDVYAIERLGNR